jgi:hypothetical protein
MIVTTSQLLETALDSKTSAKRTSFMTRILMVLDYIPLFPLPLWKSRYSKVLDI